jgi:uncharacterized protein (TIGR03067 family)
MRLAFPTVAAAVFVAAIGCSKNTPIEPSLDLDGLWGFVSSEMSGFAAPKEVMEELSWYFHGNEITVTQGCDSIPGKMTFRIDRRQSPVHFDFTIQTDDFGKTSLGICAIDGGQLRICSADPGCPRPTEFRVARNTSLMVLKKIEQ